MPDFDDLLPVSHSTGRGGVQLRSELGEILGACGKLGPVFMLFRNEACIFGSVAEPLRYLETGHVHLADTGAITLNLAARHPCTVFGYLEPGPQGGFIDAVEFCGPREAGFLKICRMERTDRARWLSLLADYHAGSASAARIAGIRKTNHLDVPACTCGAPSPAESMIDRFLDRAVQCGATLHIVAQAACARGRLTIRPTHRVQVGHWTVLSSDETAFHVAPRVVTELRIVTRPHLAQFVLFGVGGRFVARILSRDRALLSQLHQIL